MRVARGESAGRDVPWQATVSRTIAERAARIEVGLGASGEYPDMAVRRGHGNGVAWSSMTG
jgi:hypothetical protein